MTDTDTLILFVSASAFICLAVASIWFSACNEKTLAQRRAIRSLWWRSVDAEGMVYEHNAVSFHRHVWSLFFFRDPIDLYGPLTKAAYAGSSK